MMRWSPQEFQLEDSVQLKLEVGPGWVARRELDSAGACIGCFSF